MPSPWHGTVNPWINTTDSNAFFFLEKLERSYKYFLNCCQHQTSQDWTTSFVFGNSLDPFSPFLFLHMIICKLYSLWDFPRDYQVSWNDTMTGRYFFFAKAVSELFFFSFFIYLFLPFFILPTEFPLRSMKWNVTLQLCVSLFSILQRSLLKRFSSIFTPLDPFRNFKPWNIREHINSVGKFMSPPSPKHYM